MPIPKKPKKGAPGWMVSFADLQQLLLVFFILLFSMSTTDEQKFNAVMQSLNEALSTKGMGLTDTGDSTLNEVIKDLDIMTEITNQKEHQLESELKEVQSYLDKTDLGGIPLSELVKANKSPEGVILTIKDIVLFESGSAEIKEQSKALIDKLGPLIQKKNSNIRVEGHTDNVQLSANSKYKDNWELSTARASEVASFIINEKISKPNKIAVSGYSEYKPVASNDTAENKAKNRRVDVVLISDFSKAEDIAKKKVQQSKENTKNTKKQ